MKAKPRILITRIILIISLGLYVISLTQQCYCTTASCGDSWSGASIVALGAMGGIMSVAGLTWYANPLLWIAWPLISKNPKRAIFFSAGAAVVAASFLFATKIADTQAGVTSYITGYKAGYWLWLTSIIIMTIGSIVVYQLRRTEIAALKNAVILRVDFNNRCKEGIRLITNGLIYKMGKRKVKLYEGMPLIIWDEDYDDKRIDNLAVEAIAQYSYLEDCWIAAFDHDDLMHESQREIPLLSD